jgi:hypothetical protein
VTEDEMIAAIETSDKIMLSLSLKGFFLTVDSGCYELTDKQTDLAMYIMKLRMGSRPALRPIPLQERGGS